LIIKHKKHSAQSNVRSFAGGSYSEKLAHLVHRARADNPIGPFKRRMLVSKGELKGVGFQAFRIRRPTVPRKGNPAHYYPRLLIIKQTRRNLIYLTMLAFVVVTAILASNRGVSWQVLVAPICFTGLLLCLLPPSERWEYRPWQTSARQMEELSSGD